MTNGELLIGGRFKCEDAIGSGGMATVYRGKDIQTGDIVALKLLKPEVIQFDAEIVARFDREGEALRLLNHPNIVKVLATITENNQHYVVMEYVGGGDLNDLIQKHRQENSPIPIQRILEIALDLSDALTRAHRLKIIHRDIKPANVLIASDGTPRLTDFGVAHFGDSTRMTRTGAMIGTLAYLSPEACYGDELDSRSDIWSFGVMLYELLTLRRPFEQNNTAALITAIMTKDVPDMSQLRPDIPPTLIYLIQQMLAKDRDNRIASARLVGAQLEAIISGGNTWDLPISDFEVHLHDIADFDLKTPSSISQPGYKIPASVDHGEFVPDSARQSATIPHNTISPPSVVASVSRTQKSRLPLPLIGAGIVLLLIGIISGIIVLGNQPSHNASPTIIPLAPVATNELMVIVSEFAHFGGDVRDVGWFIFEDLQKKFERDVPFARIRVRQYPIVIQSADEATTIAEANHATIIIWGNYDVQGVRVNMQVGSIAPFKNYIISLEETRRLTDVTIELTNERRESLAPNVLAIINVLQTYDSNPYEIGRNLAVLELVNTGVNGHVQGNSIASRWHRYFMIYNTDEEASLREIGEAIALDSSVLLLYSARALTYIRLGQMQNMFQDIRTVQSLADDRYLADDLLLAQYYFFLGESADLPEAQRLFEFIITYIPDDWWLYTLLGGVYWQQGNFDKAQATLEFATTLSPDTNYPHVLLISIYMRQSELAKAQDMINFVRKNFPDTTIANRMLNAVYRIDGVELTYATEVFGYFILGQWRSVLEVINRANFSDAYADVYLLAGLAHCNLRQYEQAEVSYTRLLGIYPNYMLGYLLRAEVRQKQNNLREALADIAFITQSPLADRFAPLIAGAQNGTISCETILDADFSESE